MRSWTDGSCSVRRVGLRVCSRSAAGSTRRSRRCTRVRAGPSRDPYEILGVQYGADRKTIKAAYRKKALRLHPDVNKAPDAKEQFMAAKAAFQTLTDGPVRGSTSSSTRQQKKSASGFDWTDPFAGRSSAGSYQGSTGYTDKAKVEEPFYGFTEFFEDIDKEWNDRRKRRNKEDASLWEELADIGEEFVEFLENELGLDHKSAQEAASSYDSTSRDAAARKAATDQQKRDRRQARADAAARAEEEASARARRAADEAQEQARKAEQDVDDMLADLKRKMKRS